MSTRKKKTAKRKIAKRVRERRKGRPRRVSHAGVPVFGVGQRVVVDFWLGGPVSGFTRKQCQRPGLVEMHVGRFLDTPQLAEIRYRVRLDEPFCNEERWTVAARGLRAESEGNRS